MIDIQFIIRPLTGPMVIVPIVFLGLNLARFLWVLRRTLHLPGLTALRAMYGLFSIGWAIAYACVRGLIRRDGVFLRPPKTIDSSAVFSPLRVTQLEMGLGPLCLMMAVLVISFNFSLWTIFLAGCWAGTPVFIWRHRSTACWGSRRLAGLRPIPKMLATVASKRCFVPGLR
jgi:hypothetical protein